MNSVKDFRGKIEPPVEKEVLKIERYAQRLTQGYSAYEGSYLWAPGFQYNKRKCTAMITIHFHDKRNVTFITNANARISPIDHNRISAREHHASLQVLYNKESVVSEYRDERRKNFLSIFYKL